jgi:hypothetical protein
MEILILVVVLGVAWVLWGAAANSGRHAEEERPADE